jgi:hypothetical protein
MLFLEWMIPIFKNKLIYLSIYLSIDLSIYLSIYLSYKLYIVYIYYKDRII